MKKINLIVWDITDTSKQWMAKYLEQDRCHIRKMIIGSDSRLKRKDIQEHADWDYILIFSYAEDDMLDIVGDCLEETGINLKEILFPLLITDLVDKWDISHYLFKGSVRSYLEFFMEKEKNRNYMTCTVSDGLSYISTVSDNAIMGQMYISGKNWAEEEIERFFSLVKKFSAESLHKQYFFDIGANIGTTSVYVKKKLAPDIHVIAFEPVPEIFKLLKMNFLLNDILEDEYTLVNMGVSDRSEERRIRYHEENIGGSSFVAQELHENDRSILVKNISFDDYVAQHQIDLDDIACLWVDVEGFEAMFLSGASNALSRTKAPVIMEFSPRLLKNAGMYEKCLEELVKLYSTYIVIQGDDQVFPIEDLRKIGNAQVDLFLMK